MKLTIEQLRRAMPGLSVARAECYGQPCVDAMFRAAIDTPLRAAHFLAQVGHECGDFRWVEEIADGSAYEGRKDLGNIELGDGKRFKGRGAIQLTGRANYVAFGKSIGRSLVVDPSVVATEPLLVVATATWFWTRARLNELADKDDVVGITRRINGGRNGLVDRNARLLEAKKALGV